LSARQAASAIPSGPPGPRATGDETRLLALLVLFLLPGMFAQKSSVPYDRLNGEPTFTNTLVGFTYPGVYSSLAGVDFRNFTIHELHETCVLKNGHWRSLRDRAGHQSLDLISTYYLRRTASNQGDSILVLLSWFGVGGSSSSEGIAQIFTLSKGHLRMSQEMSWDTHFWTDLPTESFDTGTDSLLVRTAHYIPGDAHCCVSAMDVIRLKWDGTRFVQTSLRTELSKYGRTEGKKLPR